MRAARRTAAAVALTAAALSCGRTTPPAAAPRRGADQAIGPWRYSVVAGPAAAQLDIEVDVPAGPARRLSVDDGVEPFVRDVTFGLAGGALQPIAPHNLMWSVPPCPEAGCRLRYRFLLGEAAAALDNPAYAQERRGAMLSPPSAWLLHPVDREGDPNATRFRLRVTVPEGITFVSGLFPSPDEPGEFEATMADLPGAPYSAFGPMEVRRIEQGGGAVQVAILPGEDGGVDRAAVLGWVSDAARSVTHYYGRYPVDHALVIILPTRGTGPGFASALGNGGASILARVGQGATEDDLAKGWEMTHEMIHTAFPNLDRRHIWLEEGLATYVEPIARSRLGLVPVDHVWLDMARGLPKGLPMPGDRGLDNTPTWGRTYWGGALFCLLADLEIRERTANARSLDDALRAIVAAGGNISIRWPIERALAEGDRATGVPVLAELYARMKDAPFDVDLDALFRGLGIGFLGGRVVYDDGAPLARIRTSITAPDAIAEVSKPSGPSALRDPLRLGGERDDDLRERAILRLDPHLTAMPLHDDLVADR